MKVWLEKEGVGERGGLLNCFYSPGHQVREGWSEVRLSGVLPPLSSKAHQTATLLTVLQVTRCLVW